MSSARALRPALPAVLPRVLLAVLLAVGVVLATGVGPASARAGRETRIHHADRIALRQIGDPYVWGATGPHAFDCSGLVQFATHRAGFPYVPRVAAQQARFMRHIPKRKLRRGDFMFFYGPHRWDVYHVAFFQGWRHGRAFLLAAPHTGARVRREPVWTQRWFAGTLRFKHPRRAQHRNHHGRHHSHHRHHHRVRHHHRHGAHHRHHHGVHHGRHHSARHHHRTRRRYHLHSHAARRHHHAGHRHRHRHHRRHHRHHPR